MSAANWRSAPPLLEEASIDHAVREQENDALEDKVKKFESIRLALKNKSASTAYEKAKEAWKALTDKDKWTNHGHVTRRLEEAYLSTRAGLDIKGNNAKESETVGFFELWLPTQFPEKRFFLKSQFGVRARKGPEQQVDNLLGYITVHMLQQPMIMIEAKRHPKGREYMRPAELAALEDQVEEYCRTWLKDNPDIPFIDPGLDCDAEIISAAINLIKENPNGSDYAVTTTSGSQSQSDQAPSAVPSGVTGGTSGSRHRTPSVHRRDDRTRSRDRTDNRSNYQSSSQEEIPQKRSERHKTGREESKGKELGRSERGERRETSDRQHSQKPSASIAVPRSSSRGGPRRSIERGNLASSSSPEHSAQTPIPIREPREKSTKDGKRVEASRSSKPLELGKRDFDARRTDSLSTRPSTSPDDTSSSDNRAPRSKSTKQVVEASADGGRKTRDKPSGSR
ncbi:hypothetical protein EAE96_010819 [Botrytis aclada]|nr:hypothetical protein EAE96_010819 [Botrytis aclada]